MNYWGNKTTNAAARVVDLKKENGHRNRSKSGKYARKQENARSNSPWSTAWWRSTDWSVTLAAHHYYEGGSTSGGGGLNFIIVKPCNSLHIYYILYTIYIYTIYYIHIYYEGSTGGGDGPNFIIVKPCNSLLTMAFQSSISGTHRHYMQCFMVQTIFYTIVQCASFHRFKSWRMVDWAFQFNLLS